MCEGDGMAEWKECRLGDYCDYGKDRTEVSSLDNSTYISTENMLSNRAGITTATTLPTGEYTPSFELNDPLVSNIRPYFKKIWKATFSGGCSADVLVFKAKENFSKEYLYYVLADDEFFKYSMATSKGTKMPRGDKTSIMNYPVKLPPLPTQQKIAAILSSLDDKIELNKKINTNLEQQIETLLLDYLSKKETTSVKLGDYLYIKGRIGWKGLKKNEYLSESKYRIINGETLTKSGIDWNKAGYISEERYTESPEIMLQIGDILLSKDGTIGKIGYVDELELPTSVASGIFVIRNNNPSVISTTFIYYLLKSKLFDSFIIARTEGSVIPHLYQKDFMDFDFPLPSPELMNEFEKTTSPMFNQIINNLKENKKLNSLCNSLLPKLMNGEII